MASGEAARRVFIALPLPHEAARAVVRRCAPYRARFTHARWLPGGALHLTLLFVGSVPGSRVPELRALVEALAAHEPPFMIRTAPGGGRVRGADGVAWLGLSEGGDAVMRLARRAATGCPSGIMTGGRVPRMAPSPHLTVARRADAHLVAALACASEGQLEVTWTADRVALMESHPGPGGAAYGVVHEARLSV